MYVFSRDSEREGDFYVRSCSRVYESAADHQRVLNPDYLTFSIAFDGAAVVLRIHVGVKPS